MCDASRRDFLKLSAATTAAAASYASFQGPARTAEARALAETQVGQPMLLLGPGQSYQLLIQGGEVLDPRPRRRLA